MVLIALLGVVPAGANSCQSGSTLTGGCQVVSNNGTAIGVGGSQTSPGVAPIGDGPLGPNTGNGSNNNNNNGQPWYPPAEFDFDACLVNWDSYIGCFRAGSDDETLPVDDAAAQDDPGMPPVTINDLIQFAPDPTLALGEPSNVGVAGLPTNFVAVASVQTQSGTLFGYPLSVRFTPVAYDFHFGDGNSITSSVGGQSWTALNVPQFTPTATSHTYAARGSYSAQVDVRYSAEIDLGIGWFTIQGEVTAWGQPQEVRIFEAHTALVAHTCAEKRDSPGCDAAR